MTRFSPRSWLKSWRSASRAARGRTRRTAARLKLEALEERQLLAVFTVTNTNDAGAGSLRQAILNANAEAGPDTIAFAIGSGAQTIAPTSALPQVTDPVFIDGTTQPGYAGAPLIELSGPGGGAVSGLVITAGNSQVRGLVINRFRNGILLTGSGGNVFAGNYLGTDLTGSVARGNFLGGVTVEGSDGSVIGGTKPGDRNVISGNGSGVRLVGAHDVRVQGNYIGTDAAGAVAVGNDGVGSGVDVSGGARNVIGGIASGAGNLIAGNRQQGINVELLAADTLVQGNYIGTDAAGTRALGNGNGILLDGAGTTYIGGTEPGARNLISGNLGGGITDVASPGRHVVRGNWIGVDATGTRALGNGSGLGTFADMTIGGTEPGAGNVIVFNGQNGVLVDTSAGGNIVRGNYIGFNAGSGVVIGSRASGNVIGGSAAGEGNTIAFNGNHGVVTIAGGRNLLRGNAISENGALGIDADSDGVTLAHIVLLTGASTSGTDTTIEGWLFGAPNATYIVELFENVVADPSARLP